MKNHNKKGQATLEYLIVLTVIILAILVVMTNLAAKDKTKGVAKLVDASGVMITNATAKIVAMTGNITSPTPPDDGDTGSTCESCSIADAIWGRCYRNEDGNWCHK